MRVSALMRMVGVGVIAGAMLSPMGLPAQAPVQNVPVAAAPATQEDLGATQEQLMRLLRVSPTLADVVASDPSLLADQQYVAKSNPELAGFLAQHPEIGRNSSFWLFSELRSPQQRYYEILQPKRGFVPARESRDELDRVMNSVAPVIVMIVLLWALVWIIRTLSESKRWTKMFTLQSEVHAKLIDRFATNQELLGYMETDAGRRFLEASPIVTEAETRRMPNLVSRIIATLQVGLVLTLLGAGLVSLRNVVGDNGTAMLVLGIVALMPGIGLILSAGVLWLLGKRLNLMETAHVHGEMDVRGRE